jgi:hypothetical protein
MFASVMRRYRVRKPRRTPTPYDVELRAYRQQLKEARKSINERFWESQMEVEHEWLTKYNNEQLNKYRKTRIHNKESVIKIAKATTDRLDRI